MKETQEFILPGEIAGIRQVQKCIHALESLSDTLLDATVRLKAGVSEEAEPVPVPRIVVDLVNANRINLESRKDVLKLKEMLETFSKRARRFKFTFAAEPEDQFVAQLVEWLRTHINLYVLVEINISPYIAGGFILQTPARRYDFSWRNRFEQKGTAFVELLKTIGPN